MYKIETVRQLYNYVINANNVGKLRVNPNLAEAAASLPLHNPPPTYTTACPAVSHPPLPTTSACVVALPSSLALLPIRHPCLIPYPSSPRINYLFYGIPLFYYLR